ncbi:hypothetical protein BJX61DRAFT_524248 [Aspergillus egyptiacus]|nr:hypothetical protein BJX61DRAFT_524248 [Aspergillus egyptiacus]
MIRCSHATALRTQFQQGVTLRAPLASSWARAPQRSSFIPRLRGTHPLASRIATPSRSLSTQPELDAALQAATQVEDPPIPTRGSNWKRRPEPDIMFRVAMNQVPVSPNTVRLELKWLRDRVALAKRVGSLLDEDSIALAAELVRRATVERMDTVVSWNHILKYCFRHRNGRAAFKFWNDMKKRGVKPNDRSYTIMLQGLSRSIRPKGMEAVQMARMVYKSIWNSNSKIKPSVIHTNAMLNFCAGKGEMDTLWEIAGEMPEEGPESPDEVTYTTILKAVRNSLHREVAKLHGKVGEESERVQSMRSQAIADAKRVWADVVYRWKRGTFEITGELVSSMAAMLLEGNGDQHLFEVFQLYHQTMGIPILADQPAPGSTKASGRLTARGGGYGAPRQSVAEAEEEEEEEDVPFVDERGEPFRSGKTPASEKFVDEEVEEEEDFSALFNPVVPTNAKPYTEANRPADQQAPFYAPIGNRELTIILNTCTLMTQPVAPGKKYWQHLTLEDHGYRVEPDLESFVQYLRILRVARASRATVELFRDQMVPADLVKSKAFLIAMSTCRRDRKNPNILNLANELLRLMDTSLLIPDQRAVVGYLDLISALEAHPQDLVFLNGLQANEKTSKSSSRDLSVLGTELLVKLRLAAVNALRPVVAQYEEAINATVDSPVKWTRLRDFGRPDQLKKHGQSGHQVLVIMTRVRMLIDAILKAQIKDKSLLPKTARWELEQQAKVLRKYSAKETVELYKTMLIYPSEARYREYYEKRFGSGDGEVKDGETGAGEAQASESPVNESPVNESPVNELQASEANSEDKGSKPSISDSRGSETKTTSP